MFTLDNFSDSHYFVNTVLGALGDHLRTPKAYFIFFWSVQARRLLDCLAVILQVASGTRDPTLGWSGILDRKLSSSNLKRSWSFLIWRNFLGRQLKSLAPSVWKLCSRSVWMAFLPFWTIWGILHFLPNLALSSATSIPQFGAYPSKIFHMYITW